MSDNIRFQQADGVRRAVIIDSPDAAYRPGNWQRWAKEAAVLAGAVGAVVVD